MYWAELVRRNNPSFRHIKFIVVILMLSLYPFFKSGFTGVFVPPDAGGGLDMFKRFMHYCYTWDELSFTGGMDNTAWYIPSFISHLFLAIPFIFFSLEIAQRIMFTSILFFQGISMYFFTYRFVKIKDGYIAALISSIFYMFNPWFLGNWWTGNFFFNWGSVFLPLALWAVIRGMENKMNLLTNAVLLAIICTFMLTPHIQSFILQIYLLILYLFFYLITKRDLTALSHSIKFLFASISVFLMLNLFWVIPTIGTLTGSYEYLVTLDPLRGFRENLSYIRSFEYIRLLGMGIYNVSFDAFYSLRIGCFTSFSLTILAFTVLLRRLKDNNILFFSIAALAFTFTPLLIARVQVIQDVYVKLINIPILGIVLFPRSLRFPQLAVLAYAFLIGVSTVLFFSRSKQLTNYFRYAFLSIVAVLVLLNAEPMLFGDLGRHFKPVKIPAYYDKIDSWLSEQNRDFKLFLTPHAHWWTNIRYTWAKNIIRHVDFVPIFYIPKPSIQKLPDTGFDKGIIEVADSAIHNSSRASRILSLYNIKYILHRRDVEPYANIVLDFKPLDKHIQFRKSFGKLDLYKISDEYFLSHIYASPDKTGL